MQVTCLFFDYDAGPSKKKKGYMVCTSNYTAGPSTAVLLAQAKDIKKACANILSACFAAGS
jgi:hypothetical protein